MWEVLMPRYGEKHEFVLEMARQEYDIDEIRTAYQKRFGLRAKPRRQAIERILARYRKELDGKRKGEWQ